ncbi:MAG: heavy-metal-associated domain-containing protein [candidate division Zixibacteria bacterium]|nr:heavy-metal-associated domain-containing protein [candidate division Zixibacteria bacterium]
MKKAAIFGFALVLGLALVSAPMTVFAGNCATSAKTSASADKANASQVKAVGSCSADKVNKSAETSTSAATEQAGVVNAQYATANFKVKGMTCAGCEAHLTKVLQGNAAVTSVDKVSYADGTAMIHYDPSKVDCPSKFTAMINDAGYQAELIPAVAIAGGAMNAKMTSDKACDPAMCAAAKACDPAACAAMNAKMTSDMACDPAMCAAAKTCDPSACAAMGKTVSTDDGSR